MLISDFKKAPWPQPLEGVPIFMDFCFSEVHANEIWERSTSYYQTARKSQIYQENGRTGHVDTRVRDTSDLSSKNLLTPEEIGVYREGCLRGAKAFGLKLGPAQVPYQVLGYKTGGHFLPHSDSHITVNGQWENNTPRRKISSILYLNSWTNRQPKRNEFLGGELEFTEFGFRLQPRAGLLCVFPSHPLFRHRVLSVTSGWRVAVVQFWDSL